ncbi:G1 family glutamic endopeptidase [Caldivirga sp.]|uniref:G1 family glutamic endopeptidase n=1 Tax=Caldivirga sp. TaxID=2080243 RepID=UPI0025C5683D|nr:G1 family glutamic endopeptidase [Caldivirga sp.]
MKNRGIVLGASVLALTLLMLVLSLSTAKLVVFSHQMIKVSQVNGQVASLNWAGYVVPANKYTVTSVAGSFIVPSLTCSKQTTYVALWAGLDGYSDNTVEQAGVLGECEHGKAYYYAWYEFYPSPAVFISGFTVKPGDKISVTVSYIGNSEFKVTINDVSESESYTTTGSVSGAELSSAECILERPMVNGHLSTLANFGTAYYGQDYTSIPGTCYATINGVTEPFGSFPSVTSITMVNYNGETLAYPSALSSDGSSFTVTYG